MVVDTVVVSFFPQMPKQLWRLCLCHLLTWFSIIAEAVFYTDFMGQVIFNGNPQVQTHCHRLTFCQEFDLYIRTNFKIAPIYAAFFQAPANSTELQNYHKGVQMGCWGLVVYAATAAVCSGMSKALLHIPIIICVASLLHKRVFRKHSSFFFSYHLLKMYWTTSFFCSRHSSEVSW